MASHTKRQYRGSLAELNVLEGLLHTGSAINSLTGTDTGWDLHLHIPTSAMNVSRRNAPAQWPLSGRTVHVQVKGVAARGYPVLKLGTVRGWVSGTYSGTPTFLFMHRPDGSISYHTPNDLQAVLDAHAGEEDDFEVVVKGCAPAKYDVVRFAHLMQMWVDYPTVMRHDDQLELFVIDPSLAPATHPVTLIGEVAAGWLSSFHPNASTGYTHWSIGVTAMASRGADALRYKGKRYDKFIDEVVIEEVSGNQGSGGSGWSPGVPPSWYSTRGTESGTLEDAQAFIYNALRATR